MSDHIKALFEGQELSEEFKTKTQNIFEAAVEEKAKEIRESIEAELLESNQVKVDEKMAELEKLSESYIAENVVPQIDRYLTAAVQEWLEENKIAVQAGAKVELAESFLSGLVGLAESHNLELPQGEFDKVKELETKLSEMKDSMVALKDQNIELKESVRDFTKGKIVESLTESLTDVQKEKFVPVANKVEFKSEEQFSEAVKSLFVSYFPVNEKDEEDEDEIDVEDEDGKDEDKKKKDKMNESSDPYMSNMLKHIL